MKIKSLILIGLFITGVASAQQPFEKYGYKVKISTLSQGKYVEDFTSDSLVQVGSVMINRVTGKIASFITYDTVYSEATLDPQLISRWMSVDPLADEFYDWSPYNFVYNNPIRFTDPDGRAAFDWVKNGDGEIYWDPNANSQATTQAGETYLGKDLTFTFNSYIDGALWDGPGGSAPAGDKLTSTVTITGHENEAGELTGISASTDVQVGSTPIGTARDFFPGLGDGQNSMSSSQSQNSDGTLSNFSMSFEQHASVSPIEAAGLNIMGYDIVNVAQKLDVGVSNNKLSISAGTDVFPSATLSVNGSQLFKYNQPSFRATHGRDTRTVIGDNGRGGSVTTQTTSRRPAPSFFTRYKQ